MQCSRIHFTLTKTKNNLNSAKNLYIVGRSLRDKKVTTYLQLAQKGNLSTKFDKTYFFYQHSQTLYDVMQEEIENLEFVQGFIFDFIDSLIINGTKYLCIFDD